MFTPLLISVVLGALSVRAAPTSALESRTVSVLSTSAITAFTPYTWYASAGYCTPAQTLAWTCGANCNATPNFKPVASGGDSAVQYWFVGYDTALASVIVSHQGTVAANILPLIEDASIAQVALSSTLFPGISSSILVHSGFAAAHALTATSVLAAVKSAMSKYSTTKVTMVGHSLGGAISLLDSVYLPLNLPSGTTFKTVAYGLPRVGNQAFADYIDANASLTHINNKKDIVPILPGRFLGFVHPAGEVHIAASGEWDACSGQDNTASQCEIGTVANILVGSISDHDGPYNGITMGCSS